MMVLETIGSTGPGANRLLALATLVAADNAPAHGETFAAAPIGHADIAAPNVAAPTGTHPSSPRI